MFKIYDGREHFYQWDLDRKLIVYDETIQEVHFWNKTDDCCLVCEVYTEGKLRLVNVPNILLQDNWRINAYGYDGRYTKHSDKFDVKSRAKPADYVYTETECKRWEDLEERITALEENSGSGGSADLTGYATEEYVDNKVRKVEKDINDIGVWVGEIESEFGGTIPYIYNAEVGQVLSVANTNDDGVPTEWETINLPSGGGNASICNFTITTEQAVNAITVELPTTFDKFYALNFYIAFPNGLTEPLTLYSHRNGKDFAKYETLSIGTWFCCVSFSGYRDNRINFGFKSVTAGGNYPVVPGSNGQLSSKVNFITFYSYEETVNFPVGTRIDVWGVYKQ